jgi:ubiquinone/menaquinone biosynthesis C-methylase UbiE
MITKKYNLLYSKDIFKINVPQNTITRIFLSRMSPLKKKFKDKKILDFSCGSGPYLNFFLNLGLKVFATEISNTLISILKKKYKKIQFKVGTNKKINFPNNFFKYFVSIHSIYYMQKKSDSFDETIKLVRSKLERNGYFIFTLPKLNLKHLKFKKVEKNIYKIINDKYKLRKNSYFYIFKNKKELKKYFSKFFKIIEVGSIFSNFKNLEENYYLCIMQKK